VFLRLIFSVAITQSPVLVASIPAGENQKADVLSALFIDLASIPAGEDQKADVLPARFDQWVRSRSTKSATGI
jgi:hypothetical protein